MTWRTKYWHPPIFFWTGYFLCSKIKNGGKS